MGVGGWAIVSRGGKCGQKPVRKEERERRRKTLVCEQGGKRVFEEKM